jgi:hypothetical protein
MNRFRLSIILGIVGASGAVSLAIQRHTRGQLRDQDEATRQQIEQLTELSAENQQLSNLIARVNSTEALSTAQLKELLRLRNEAGQLRQSAAARTSLEETNARLRSVEAKADRQLAEAQAAPNYWPKDQLAYAGYSDPESSLKSALAAMRSGDLNAWREHCTPQAIADVEKEWKERGLSETERLAEFRKICDMLMSAAVGFHILDRKNTSPDETIINLSFDGEGAARKFVLRKVGSEWKFHNFLLAGEEAPER